MKKYNRWLSALLCLCMMVSTVLGAYAEEGSGYEVVIESIDTVETPVETESPELELGGETAADPGAASQPAPTEDSGVNYDADASQSPDFTFGYAQLSDGAALYPDATSGAVAVLGGGVVLAIGRAASGEDRLQVTFVVEDAVLEGWVDAQSLRPMSPDEVNAFQSGIVEAYCYQDNVEYPLAELAMTAVSPSTEARCV